MKVVLDQILKELNGDPLKSAARNKDGSKRVVKRDGVADADVNDDAADLSLREVIETALTQGLQDQKKPSDATESFKLAVQVHGAETEVELKSQEVTKIKELLSKTWASPLVSGQAIEMIEPSE